MRFGLLITVLSLLFGVPAGAQLPPATADQLRPPPPTPLPWKWERFDGNTTFRFAARAGQPLVLIFPDSPGDGYGGIDAYLARFLFDQGYAIGTIDWRGDFGRTALPSAIVARAFGDLARVRAASTGRFDPNRIVMLGTGDSSFLALLVSDDRDRLQSVGVPGNAICATVLFSPSNLDPVNPGSFDAGRQFSREPRVLPHLSPLALVSSGSPTLIMSELLDHADQARGDAAALAFRDARKPVVRETYPRRVDSDERTYVGEPDNDATAKLATFLKSYCPSSRK